MYKLIMNLFVISISQCDFISCNLNYYSSDSYEICHFTMPLCILQLELFLKMLLYFSLNCIYFLRFLCNGVMWLLYLLLNFISQLPEEETGLHRLSPRTKQKSWMYEGIILHLSAVKIYLGNLFIMFACNLLLFLFSYFHYIHQYGQHTKIMGKSLTSYSFYAII